MIRMENRQDAGNRYATITTSATDAIAPTNGNTVDRKNSPISSRRTNAHIPAHSPMSSGMYILKAPMDMKYAIGRTDTASRTIAASGLPFDYINPILRR